MYERTANNKKHTNELMPNVEHVEEVEFFILVVALLWYFFSRSH
jgi:hypothetical protein